MRNKMEYTTENIEKVAKAIVDSTDLNDLRQVMYEDLIFAMKDCRDTFDLGVESLDWDENPTE